MSNHVHLPNAYSAPLLADMPRWIDIAYPPLMSAGSSGVVYVPTHKVLRWAAAGWQGATGIYLADLADRLSDCGAPPLHSHARTPLDDDGDWRIYIDYPADVPAPPTASGDRARELCVPAGLVLSWAADDLERDNPSEAARLRLVMERHFPDWDIVLEFALADGQTGWISNFSQPTIPHNDKVGLEPAIGSAVLDHYGDGSAFSSDAKAYPYAVHPIYDDEYPGELPCACYFVSNGHTLEAGLFFNDDAS
jgi:hypothetical protein